MKKLIALILIALAFPSFMISSAIAGGIDNKTYKQIFHPYFSTKTSEKNTGIGLYMAKTIIDGMQGSLSYTRVNNESHFKITLKGLEHAWNTI